MNKPLSGLKVLDLSRVLAGPFCGMLLADMGAETIKIEMPGRGDDSRGYPPFVNEESAYFMSVNRNKKSMTLNLKSQEGKEIFKEMVKKADVVVENFRPGTMKRLGLDYEVLKEINPSIIYGACSGYGQYGPSSELPAYDMIVQAMGGLMSITGPDENHMSRVGSSIGDVVAGVFTALGIVSAVVHRQNTGEGQLVDVAMLDCQMSILENAIARYFVNGVNPKPMGNRHPSIEPFGEVKTKDSSMVVAAGNDQLFVKLCKILGDESMATDPSYQTNQSRVEHMDQLFESLNGHFEKKSTNEWIAILREQGIPCGPINKIGDAVNEPSVIARDMIVEVTNTKGDAVKMPGIPIKFSKTPCSVDKAAPLLGEDTAEILLNWCGIDSDRLSKLQSDQVI